MAQSMTQPVCPPPPAPKSRSSRAGRLSAGSRATHPTLVRRSRPGGSGTDLTAPGDQGINSPGGIRADYLSRGIKEDQARGRDTCHVETRRDSAVYYCGLGSRRGRLDRRSRCMRHVRHVRHVLRRKRGACGVLCRICTRSLTSLDVASRTFERFRRHIVTGNGVYCVFLYATYADV